MHLKMSPDRRPFDFISVLFCMCQIKGGHHMKKNLSEIVFLLDRSGSMSGLEKDTIGGFNAMIEKQKKEEGEAEQGTGG